MSSKFTDSLPRKQSIGYAAAGYFAVFSILVFVTDTLWYLFDGPMPLFIHILVYVFPLGFAIAGWNYGSVPPGENP